MTNTKKEVKAGDIITSIERGLNVLLCFDQQAINLTPADVARRANLPRAAARRVLITLEQLGYAVTDGKYYRLTPKVLDLGHGYLSKVRVRDMIDPILADARHKTSESCALMIRDGGEMLCIASSNPNTIGYVPFDTGTRVALHGSSSGRCLLATLPEKELAEYIKNAKLVQLTPKTITKKADLRKEIDRIRSKGFAMTVDEYSIGIFGMAVPVTDKSGKFLASISCLGNVARAKTKKERDHILSVLQNAAERISAMLPENYDFTND